MASKSLNDALEIVAKKYNLPFLELYPEDLSGFFRGKPIKICPMGSHLADYDAYAWFNELFGRQGSGIVYPVGAMACSLSNAVFSSVIGFAYDLTGGYALMLATFVIFIACADVLVLWGYGRKVQVTQ